MINSGSLWRRWDPHIHAPDTVLNDQFSGADVWDLYLTKLESANPIIESIAVTDYYLIDAYQKVVAYKEAGRLPKIGLIFPNIEIRLDVAAKSGFVNLHLLVSPEDPNHIVEIQRFMNRLTFEAFNDRYSCTKEDLIKLGKNAYQKELDDRSALEHGATQFKVSFSQLRDVYKQSDWAKNNILIAVAGGEGDGTSGIRLAADTTMRQEIEKFAHIIFSGNPKQRDFWIGRGSVSQNDLKNRYDGCKPCLHGSDAHSIEKVGNPISNRYCWIKGGLEFDALRQACIDPESRAFVGDNPPPSATPSQIIKEVVVNNASWAQTPKIQLNSGLIAIIGARGSGKTALADIIAAGCDSISARTPSMRDNASPSFLSRASQYLESATVNLSWGQGEDSCRSLKNKGVNSNLSYPRARYLSQQFVEELCSASGLSDGLVEEIERVILESHPVDDREGATSFDEFRESRVSRYQQARSREADSILALSDRIAIEMEKESSISHITQQISQKEVLIKNYKNDIKRLVLKATEAQVIRHKQLNDAAKSTRDKINTLKSKHRTFIVMQDEVLNMREIKLPEILRQTQQRYIQGGLSSEQWDDFLLMYKGDVDDNLFQYIKKAEDDIADLKGEKPTDFINGTLGYIADDADVSALKLEVILAEIARLELLFSSDRMIRDQYALINKKISQEEGVLNGLYERLNDAKDATPRRKGLQEDRYKCYERLFDAIISQQRVLADLYAPLMNKIINSSGTLKRLSFRVKRIVDIDAWASFAEENLLDLRKTGPFYGRGSFTAEAKRVLQPVWESGSVTDIKSTIVAFINSHFEYIKSHAPCSRTQKSLYKAWLRKFTQWFFSVDHISIRYEILYDGIDIRKLSPGTRGVVLLLLYLALDDNDDRPLIIDQPEENLDPKSVNDELVPLFIAAKSKRQVIIVTHNANLVINTDADQVIIADAKPHEADGLPQISYTSGGLENSLIREAVRDILEGGETAFQERARRLRVRLSR